MVRLPVSFTTPPLCELNAILPDDLGVLAHRIDLNCTCSKMCAVTATLGVVRLRAVSYTTPEAKTVLVAMVKSNRVRASHVHGGHYHSGRSRLAL